MSTYKNLMTVCCAAVLALGLAACGSSDKTATPATTADGYDGPGGFRMGRALVPGRASASPTRQSAEAQTFR